MDLFTIGHSTRALDELIHILRAYKIETLIDVRRFPRSKRFPHFNRDNLEESLLTQEIKYCWLGESLGGFRKEGYSEYAKTEAFEIGINQLLRIAANSQTTIMCSELNWTRCHRKHIAERLVEMGHRVTHILDKNQLYEHTPREKTRSLELFLSDFMKNQ